MGIGRVAVPALARPLCFPCSADKSVDAYGFRLTAAHGNRYPLDCSLTCASSGLRR
jgi:hypothetical protein